MKLEGRLNMAIDFNKIKEDGYGDGYTDFYIAGESSTPT